MPAPSESVKALERGSNSTLLIAVVSAMLAGGGWLLVTAAVGTSQLQEDGTYAPSVSPGFLTLVGAVSGFCVLLCAAMWAAHVVLSSLTDAERARETAASEARAAAQRASA